MEKYLGDAKEELEQLFKFIDFFIRQYCEEKYFFTFQNSEYKCQIIDMYVLTVFGRYLKEIETIMLFLNYLEQRFG